MPVSFNDRWKCQVLSPIDSSVLWEGRGPTTKSIADKYSKEIGNDFITAQKLNRTSLGKSKNPLIKIYKIGEYSSRGIEKMENTETPKTV